MQAKSLLHLACSSDSIRDLMTYKVRWIGACSGSESEEYGVGTCMKLALGVFGMHTGDGLEVGAEGMDLLGIQVQPKSCGARNARHTYTHTTDGDDREREGAEGERADGS